MLDAWIVLVFNFNYIPYSSLPFGRVDVLEYIFEIPLKVEEIKLLVIIRFNYF